MTIRGGRPLSRRQRVRGGKGKFSILTGCGVYFLDMALVRFSSGGETGSQASTYFGWVEEISDSLMIISLKILDGNRLWDGVLGVENKPHSRRQETNREFFNLLKDSLSEINERKFDYSFQSPGNGVLSFVIKERMAEMSALIARYDFTSSSQSSSSLSSLYHSIYGLISSKDENIRCLTKEIQSNRVALDSLSQEHIQNTQNRETFQRDFFTKFCLIVNSKKDEIKRLCGEVNQSKEQIESLKAQLASLQEQNLRNQTLALSASPPVGSGSGGVEIPESREKPKPKKAASKKRVAPRYTKGTPSQTQSSESKSYLSDEDDGDDDGGEEDSDLREHEKKMQLSLESNSFVDRHTVRDRSVSGRKREKIVIKPDPDGPPLLDPSQSSQMLVLPPRGVEVGGSRDLEKILSHSSSQHDIPQDTQIVLPIVKEEKESVGRSATQLTASQSVPGVSSGSIPLSSVSVAPAPSRGAVKPMTRVRQMFGSSSEEDEERERPQKKITKKTIRDNDDNDLLNYM
jgi:hypothetical protein